MHLQSTEMCTRETTKQECHIFCICVWVCICSVSLCSYLRFKSSRGRFMILRGDWHCPRCAPRQEESVTDLSDLHRTAADLLWALRGVKYCETAYQLDKEMAHPHTHSQNTVLTAAIALVPKPSSPSLRGAGVSSLRASCTLKCQN